MDLGILVSVVVFLAFLAAIGFGLRYLIPVLISHLKGSFGSASGWDALSSAYGTSSEPKGEVLKRQSLVAGSMVYRYLVTAGIADEGLYLAVGGPLPRPPVLIPWDAFKEANAVRLFWQKAVLVSLGAPQVSTLTLPMPLYDKMRPHLPPRLAAFGTASERV